MDTFKIGGDLEVRRLGFGAMRITGDGIWGPPDDPDSARALLRRVVELGINLIDTADSYGPEVSENLIAEALHPYPDGLVIATKGGLTRTGPGEWPRDGRPEHLREACEGSLRRLKLDRIDLYQLHAPDDKVPYEDSVGALKELQDEGKIRHIGVSNVSVEQLEQAREIVDVVTVQNRYNLTDRSSEDVLDACEDAGIGFIPWFPLATGSLAEPGGALDEVARAHDATPGQVALAWLLARSKVMLPIPGTSSAEHLEENLAAEQLILSDEERDRLPVRVRGRDEEMTSEPTSLDHVALWVGERDALAGFLCDHLGMHVIEDRQLHAGRRRREAAASSRCSTPRARASRACSATVVLRVRDLDAVAGRAAGRGRERRDGVPAPTRPAGLRIGLWTDEASDFDLDHVVLRVPDPGRRRRGARRAGLRAPRRPACGRRTRTLRLEQGDAERRRTPAAQPPGPARGRRPPRPGRRPSARGLEIDDVKDARQHARGVRARTRGRPHRVRGAQGQASRSSE